MAIVVEEYTTDDQRSIVRFFLWPNGLDAKHIHKKCFLFTVGSFCRVKRFTTESRNSPNDVQKSQIMPYQVRK
jgi:hypothetical protein